MARERTSYQRKSRLTYTPSGHFLAASQIGSPVRTPIDARAAAALKRVESLTHAVLSKAFRGELVPTEAELTRRENRTYEPASELLARIRATAATPTKAKRPRKSPK